MGVVSICLCDVSQEHDLHINDLLVEKGIACVASVDVDPMLPQVDVTFQIYHS